MATDRLAQQVGLAAGLRWKSGYPLAELGADPPRHVRGGGFRPGADVSSAVMTSQTAVYAVPFYFYGLEADGWQLS